MEYFLLVILCALYYIVYISSVMYSQGYRVMPLIIYIGVFVLYAISFIFISPEYESRGNYICFLCIGVIVYSWMSISGFWTRPLELKVKQLTKSTKEVILNKDYEKIESLAINIVISRLKGKISLIITVILTITAGFTITEQLQEEFVGGILFGAFLFFFLFLAYLIIDIVLWIKRKRFAFISIRPLFANIWLIIFAIAISIKDF